MKKIIFTLLVAVGLVGCTVTTTHTPYHYNGCTDFCDEDGCREVCGSHYYASDGVQYYYDPGLHIWVGPHGYWHGREYHRGYHPEYRHYERHDRGHDSHRGHEHRR